MGLWPLFALNAPKDTVGNRLGKGVLGGPFCSAASPLGSHLLPSEVQLRRVPLPWEACWFYKVSASFPNDTDTRFIYMYRYKGQSLAIAPVTLSEGREEEQSD